MVVVVERLQPGLHPVRRLGRDVERQLDRPTQGMAHVVEVVIAARPGHDHRHLTTIPLSSESLVVVHVGSQQQVGRSTRLCDGIVQQAVHGQ